MPQNRSCAATYVGLLIYAVLNLTSMAFMGIGAAILIACVLFDRGGPRAFFAELKAVFRARVIRIYAALSVGLILALVASLVSERWFPLTFGGYPAAPVSWVEGLGKSWYFVLPLVLLVAWRRLTPERQSKAVRAWLVCFAVLSALGVYQFFTGWPISHPNPIVPGRYHPILLLGHHLSVASIWIFPFFAALDLAADSRLSKRIGLSPKILLPALLCALFTLILGASRTLWVGLPIGLIAWGFARLSKRARLVGCAALLAGVALCTQNKYVQNRLHTSMGVGDRITLWHANWEFFKHRPVFGVGFRRNQPLSYDYFRSIHPGQTDFFIGHAHNMLLECLAGIGLFGTIAWVAWMAGVFWLFWQAMRARPPLSFAHGLFCAWIVFVINGATQVNFWEGKVLHQVMWVTALGLWWVVSGAKSSQRP